jgi:two-component system response regulator PilR (NtrC family)
MKIAVVSTNTDFSSQVCGIIGGCGHEAVALAAWRDALAAGPDAVFAQWEEGRALVGLLEGLAMAAVAEPPRPVIVFVPSGAWSAIRRIQTCGAADVLSWPPDEEEVRAEIADILGRATRSDGVDPVRWARLLREDLIGQNANFKRCLEALLVAARCDANILLLGETGTGKEMFARAIHELSRRGGDPFVPVSCPNVPGELLESQLFGHRKGTFTGAVGDCQGRFDDVGAGTLLLDEIGYVSLDFQSRLLRVLDQRKFRPLGGNEDRDFNARLICATAVDLERAAAEGRFRRDLLGRINQLRITIPPLRERRSDLRLLAEHFLRKHCRARQVTISRTAMEILEAATFPMNVRQLENLLIGALARSDPGTLILPRHLPEELLDASTGTVPQETLAVRVPAGLSYREMREHVCREIDARCLPELLRIHRGNMSGAVREAGIDRDTFAKRLKEALDSGESDAPA